MAVAVRTGEVVGFGRILLVGRWSRWRGEWLGNIGVSGCAVGLLVLGWIGWLVDGEWRF